MPPSSRRTRRPRSQLDVSFSGESSYNPTNTSLDSLGGWASAIEPSARRRVSIGSAQGGGSSPDVLSGYASPLTPVGPVAGFRIQHNPYQYNVLGVNASPDLASRTSPIPSYLAAAYTQTFCTPPPTLSPLPPSASAVLLEGSLESPAATAGSEPSSMSRRYVNGRPVPVRM